MDQGINFQGTDLYATPASNEDNEISAAVNYPRVTPQGYNVGWVTEAEAINAQNDNAGVDRRCAGSAWWDSGTGVNIYAVDTDAIGVHDIEIAKGEVGYLFPATTIDLYDDTTFNVTLTNSTTNADGGFRDANDALHTSAANWAANQTARSVTTTSTKLRFRISRTSGEGGIAHLRVVQTLSRNQQANRWGNDDGNEANYTFDGAQNTLLPALRNTRKILRAETQYSGNPPAEAVQLEVKEDLDPASEWRKVA